MQKCKNCNESINLFTYVIDVRHQLGLCKKGEEEE